MYTTLMADEDIAPLFKKQEDGEDPLGTSINNIIDIYGREQGVDPFTG